MTDRLADRAMKRLEAAAINAVERATITLVASKSWPKQATIPCSAINRLAEALNNLNRVRDRRKGKAA